MLFLGRRPFGCSILYFLSSKKVQINLASMYMVKIIRTYIKIIQVSKSLFKISLMMILKYNNTVFN